MPIVFKNDLRLVKNLVLTLRYRLAKPYVM